jgi:type II secretory pathway component PulJ
MTRLRADAGFTLSEVVVAMGVGMVMLLAAFSLMDVTLEQTLNVRQRVDAGQRGRQALDTLTRSLRSQVCASTATEVRPGLVAGDASSVTFHRDLSDGSVPAAPERVTFQLAGGVLTERVYKPTGPASAPVYPEAATSTRRIAADVAPDVVRATSLDRPVFSYFAYDAQDPPQPIVAVAPTTSAEAARVVRIVVRFAARPTGASTPKNSLVLEDEVFLRGTDPHDEVPEPECA